jgi:hypothetical protein
MPSVAQTALETIAPELRPVAVAMRAAILKVAPALQESIKWGLLAFSGKKIIFTLVPYKTHINLQFFEGASVDPERKLLEGTGKNLRHFKLHTVDDAKRADLLALVAKAVALDQAKGDA